MNETLAADLEKEVDIAERAYEFVINHIAQNCNRFIADGNHGEFWGAIRNDEGYVLINAAVLKREMSANGFEFDSVKKKWSDKEYLIKNTAGRYSHYTAAYGVKANYIKLKYGDLPQTQEPTKDEDYIDIFKITQITASNYNGFKNDIGILVNKTDTSAREETRCIRTTIINDNEISVSYIAKDTTQTAPKGYTFTYFGVIGVEKHS